MKETPLVSVIVPVYNVKPYLEECFDSIVDQSYSNLEIILVDDGSTDGSGELCDKLVAKDSRALIFHKPNGGLSDARNYGLRHAKGDWISFIDSDDYVSPIFIEVLLNACLETGCEISAIPFGKTFDDGKSCDLAVELDAVPDPKVLPAIDVQRLLLYQALDTGAPWRLYERDVLGVDPFPLGLYYEDLASIYKIIHLVEKVAVVDSIDLYAYRMRGNSIIRQSYKELKGESALRISNELYLNICKWYPDLSKAAASRCFSVCRMVFAQIPQKQFLKNNGSFFQDEARLWRVLKQFRKTVLFDSSARKRERLAAGIACLGERPFRTFCNCCRRLGKMR